MKMAYCGKARYRHTPDPWWDESGAIHAKSENWTPEIHSCEIIGSVSWGKRQQANIRVLCAAPEILKQARLVVAQFQDIGDENWATRGMRAAIEGLSDLVESLPLPDNYSGGS